MVVPVGPTTDFRFPSTSYWDVVVWPPVVVDARSWLILNCAHPDLVKRISLSIPRDARYEIRTPLKRCAMREHGGLAWPLQPSVRLLR
jgi:hypothetical protein